MKFGGTSVGSVDALINATQIIRDAKKDWARVVVVTSAMFGVTNLLLDSAASASHGKVDSLPQAESTLREKHFSAADALIKDENLREQTKGEINALIISLVDLCKAIAVLGEASPRAMDAVASLGERMSLRLLGAIVNDAGIESKAIESSEFVITNAHFQNAHPDFKVTTEKTRGILNPIMDEGIIPITTGFIGATPEGVTTTLGRGGSDYSAAIIGSVLPADEVWIWTDVDGIMTTDPKIVPAARMLPQLSYQEAAEMAIFGAKAMHPRALGPVIKENIPVKIRNTLHPENEGTLITKEPNAKNKEAVKAVAMIKDVAMLNVYGAAMVGAPGSYAKVFDVLGKNNINVMMVSTAASEANISMIIKRGLLGRAISNIEIALLERGGIVSEVTAEDDVAVIAVMGAKMKGMLGVASKIFSTVAKKGINIRMIAQGSSELNISFVVKEKDGTAVVRAIHEEFNLDKA